MGFWPARTLCSVVCEGHVRLLSLSPLSFLPPLRKLQIWLLSSLLRCWNIFFISFVCTLVTWGIPICRCVCFSWTPCSLLLEPYLKCVIFFLQINERRLLEFALKCSVLVFSINRLGSSQRIIIAFFIQFQNWSLKQRL